VKKLIKRQYFDDSTGEIFFECTHYFAYMNNLESLEILEQIRDRLISQVEDLKVMIDREKRGIS